MKFWWLLALLLAGCAATAEKPEPATPAPAVSSTQHLMGGAVRLDSVKAEVADQRKSKLISADQARPVDSLVSLAAEASKSARGAYFAGDMTRFEWLLGVVDEILQEAHAMLTMYAAQREEAKPKPKPRSKP